MLIDCEQCAMLDTSACDDCVVTCLLGDGPVDLSASQTMAMNNLADLGLAPRLLLVPPERRVSWPGQAQQLRSMLGRRSLVKAAGFWASASAVVTTVTARSTAGIDPTDVGSARIATSP